jgi:transposase
MGSVPGIGPAIARTLIAELPELGTLDRRQIAAPCGAVGTPQPHVAAASPRSPSSPANGAARTAPAAAGSQSEPPSSWAPW